MSKSSSSASSRTQPDIAIRVQGLKKSYGQHAVLKGVDLNVRKGSICALLGSNGAGKTTMIRILATLLAPDGGWAQINGFDVAQHPERVRMEISLTGQHAAVDEILTGRENLRMIGRLRHLSGVTGRVEQQLAQFDLLEAADRPVSTYSGGMRRRLDLAMSMVGEPAIIYLDEPTTGLDPQSRIALWKTVKSLASAGTTVLLTTHYLDEAEQLADHIAILHDGRITLQGTAEELRRALPQQHLELRFQDETALRQAEHALRKHELHPDLAALTLSVATNASVEQTAAILNQMVAASVPVVDFQRRVPTLESVFLAHVDSDEKVYR